jgi:hypothetical protein
MIVGQIYTFKSFSFLNKLGGTGMSNWEHDEKFEKPAAEFQIIKVWEDYEIGERAWGIPIDDEVKEYLSRVSNKGIDVSMGEGEPEILFQNTYVVFVGCSDFLLVEY